jgi:CRISPR/Cas system-associated exonuclease Cas4 (RecB family)
MIPVLPLTFTGQLKQTIFAAEYYNEIHKQYIDNLYLMYVAFTRAEEAMYIFCKSRDGDQLKTVSDLSRKVLGKSEFNIGTLVNSKGISEKKCAESISYKQLSLKNISDRVKIAFQGRLLIDPAVNKPMRPVNDGRILHEILSMVTFRDDIKPAIERLYIQGKIAADERGKYVHLLENSLNDLQVSTWFADGWKIMNEVEIILPQGDIKRPDRIITRSDQTLVIDYKFGTRLEPAHKKQIAEYANILIEMGYRNVEAYLWYVKLGKVVQVKI